MVEKENWYIVLELDFDPNPVEDETVIAQRIEEKRKFWSSKANDFNHGPEYRKYSQMLPDIKKDMIGEGNIRQKLIEAACKKTYDPIDKILKQIRKTEIPSDIIEKIAEKQKVDEATVKRRVTALGINIVSSKGKDFEELYKKYYKTKPQNADKFNGMKQMLISFNVEDLYKFLYAGTSIKNASNQPCDALRQRAKEKKSKEFYKNDSISGTGKKICGQCDETFKDADSKLVYDKYIEYIKAKEILDNAKKIYDITGEITPEAYDDYIGKLTENYKDRELAETVLTAFCKVEMIHLPRSAENEIKNPHEKICRCGRINDTSDGRKVCMECGLELQIKCPKCGVINDANINVCKCGFKFENINKAIALCELASVAIDNMEFTVSHAHLEDAEKFWPGNDKVKELKQKLSDKEQRVGSAVDKLKEACSNKNYYAAQKYYLSIKKISPEYTDLAIEEEMNSCIAEAERYKAIAQRASIELDIVEACTKAYEACNDCPGVREIIAKYPPSEPTNLVVSADTMAKVNILSWTKSTAAGLLYYTVIRKEGAVPISIEDGQLIDRVSICSVTDKIITPGSQYYYAVFAERAGIFSDTLFTNEPVTNLFEISGITVAAGDSTLQFSWDNIAENASVEMEKEVKGKKTKLSCNNRSNFVDKELINDVEHHYRIYLAYRIGANKNLTKGITVTGTPIKMPEPIEKLVVKPLQSNEFSIEWENLENSNIQFFYSEKKPDYFSGDILAVSALESAMKSLMVQKKTNTSGTFTYTDEELIYVIAAVVKSGSAVIGTVARVSKGGTVKVKDVNLINGRILISTDLPKDATGFVVLYRTDQFPEDISDVKTTRKYIPLKQYEYDCGLLIDSNESQNYYFSIFAEFKIDGEKDYSMGTDYLFSNVSKEIITYNVNVDKKLFGQNILELTFEAENRQFILPAIDVMSSIGVASMFKKSAKLFYQIEKQEVNGSVKIAIPLEKGMPKDTYIKAFLQDENLQGRFQLKLKIKSKLKIS